MPRNSWVVEAIDLLVSGKEAEWLEGKKDRVRVFFRKRDDTLEYFSSLWADFGREEDPGQIRMSFAA